MVVGAPGLFWRPKKIFEYRNIFQAVVQTFHTFFSCSGVVFPALGSLTSFLVSTGWGVDSLLSFDDFDMDDEGVSGCLSVSWDLTDTVSSSKSSGIAALRGSCKRRVLIDTSESRPHCRRNKNSKSMNSKECRTKKSEKWFFARESRLAISPATQRTSEKPLRYQNEGQ